MSWQLAATGDFLSHAVHKNACHHVFLISAAATGLLLLALLALLRRGGGLGQGRADGGAGHDKALASHVRHVVGCLQLDASSFGMLPRKQHDLCWLYSFLSAVLWLFIILRTEEACKPYRRHQDPYH